MLKTDKAEIKEEVAASIKNFAVHAKDEVARARAVAELSDFVKKKASLISAHFLLPAGARVLDMGCGTGEVTYALALLNPRWAIIGFDRDQQMIEFARQNYKLPNLVFQQSDITSLEIEEDSVDGIINSNILHEVYSESGYNHEEVISLLDHQMRRLKVGGTMLIRDYIAPSESEFALLELPDAKSTGSGPADMSDADLLIRFSQTARPMVTGCEGFFIEEQAARREGTRLFRLSHKWALEFIHRKTYRDRWESELRQEYTFFTYNDYRRELSRLGMRMVFSAPYSNPWVVKNCYKGRFQIYTEAYTPMAVPATNYFIVAQKVADRQSLVLEERRPSQKPVGDLQIVTVRDKKSGVVHELVKRPGEHCDIVPYRITPDNRMIVYVRSGYPRPLVNAVARGSHNLDGKKWSGHLIEPITMDTAAMTDEVEKNRQMIFDYVADYAGLRTKGDDRWYVGETYYPSPDRIDEAIEPVFVEVENPQKTAWSISQDKEVAFTGAGSIIELDAADIMLASHVGLLPDPRLELQMFELMSRHNISLPRWVGDSLPDIPQTSAVAVDPEDMLEELEPASFTEEKKGAKNLRAVKAVFVEEGRVGKAMRGLSSQDIEFVVTDDGIENVAVVVPLTRDLNNNLLVALDPQVLPVPNRLGGDGAMLNAPSFPLPRDVRTIEDAKIFIAGKFRVPTEQVASLGEGYFTHTGVTPQRVYPFMVASAPDAENGPGRRYAMVKRLWRLWGFQRFSGNLLKSIARLQMSVESDHAMSMDRSPVNLRHKDLELSTDKMVVGNKNAGYSGVPSRVLAQKPEKELLMVAEAPEAIAQPVQETQKEVQELQKKAVKRLVDSYAQAKQMNKGSAPWVKMVETPAVAHVEKTVDAVALKLKKAPELTLNPPDPNAKKRR